MTARIVSISTAPYDGHLMPAALDSLAACGARWVEPAYIVGYTEPFDEDAFTESAASAYAGWLTASGLSCYAMSSHIDLGRADAVAVFRRRMEFARRLGARVVNTNAAVRANLAGFERNIADIARQAEAIGIVVGLENPGDGVDNLFNVAADGVALATAVGSAHVRLNYDPANTASHRPDLPDPIADAITALPACGHLHLKDVRRMADGWRFTPLGEGDLSLGRLLHAVSDWPGLAVSIELPLRLSRDRDAQPRRRPDPVPVAEIETAVRQSLAYTEARLSSSIVPSGVAKRSHQSDKAAPPIQDRARSS